MWVPVTRSGAKDAPAVSSADYAGVTRRRGWRIFFSSDAPILWQFFLLVAVAFAGYLFWSRTRPRPPEHLRIASASTWDIGPQEKWLVPIRSRFLEEGSNETRAVDHNVLRVETEPLQRRSPPFLLKIHVQAGYELRAQPFRVSLSAGRRTYEPLEFEIQGEPPVLAVHAPESKKGDLILVVGLLIGKTAKLPHEFGHILRSEVVPWLSDTSRARRLSY